MSSGMFVTACLIQHHCDGNCSDDCHIFLWRSWDSCNGDCGHQARSRERYFRSNKNVQPRTIENCIELFPVILLFIKTKHHTKTNISLIMS